MSGRSYVMGIPLCGRLSKLISKATDLGLTEEVLLVYDRSAKQQGFLAASPKDAPQRSISLATIKEIVKGLTGQGERKPEQPEVDSDPRIKMDGSSTLILIFERPAVRKGPAATKNQYRLVWKAGEGWKYDGCEIIDSSTKLVRTRLPVAESLSREVLMRLHRPGNLLRQAS